MTFINTAVERHEEPRPGETPVANASTAGKAVGPQLISPVTPHPPVGPGRSGPNPNDGLPNSLRYSVPAAALIHVPLSGTKSAAHPNHRSRKRDTEIPGQRPALRLASIPETAQLAWAYL